MSPPEKRSPMLLAKGGHGTDENRIATGRVNQGRENFKQEPIWPVNAAQLHSAGVTFAWSRPDHVLTVGCPICGCQRLIMDDAEPYWLCPRDLLCEANRIPFDAVIRALAEKAQVAK